MKTLDQLLVDQRYWEIHTQVFLISAYVTIIRLLVPEEVDKASRILDFRLRNPNLILAELAQELKIETGNDCVSLLRGQELVQALDGWRLLWQPPVMNLLVAPRSLHLNVDLDAIAELFEDLFERGNSHEIGVGCRVRKVLDRSNIFSCLDETHLKNQ